MNQRKRPRDEEPHRYAKNVAGEWVHALDAIAGDTYHCDCPKPHLLELFNSEFVHADEQPPELAKQKLQELLPTLSFVTDECAICGWTERFRFNQEHHTLNGFLVSNHAGNPLYTLEIENPIYPSYKKMAEIRQLNIGFAEFKASDILQSTDARLTNLHILPITKCPQCESDAEKRLKKKTASNVGKHKKQVKDAQDESTTPLKQISIQEAFRRKP